MFNPVSEAIDFGRDYEYLLPAYYALKFVLDDTIRNFKLSTNNNDFGDFDDVIIEVQFDNGEEYVFAIQLKHQIMPVMQASLVNGNKFSLDKYRKSYDKIKLNYTQLTSNTAPFENIYFVIVTNSHLERSEIFDETWTALDPILQKGKIKTDILIRRSETNFVKNLLCASASATLFELKQQTMDPTSADFYSKLIFVTNEKSTKEMESHLAAMILNKIQTCDSKLVNSYLNYFHLWCRRGYGLFKLTKEDIKLKLAGLIFLQHIPEPSSKLDYFTESTAILWNEIFTIFFDVVIIDNPEVIQMIWNIIFLNFPPRFNVYFDQWTRPIHNLYIDHFKKAVSLPMAVYGETFNEMSLKDVYLLYWHLSLAPLVLNVDRYSEDLIYLQWCYEPNMVDRRKFILFDTKHYFNSYTNWRTLKNLRDIRPFQDIYNKLLNEINISIQGRSPIKLKNLIDNDNNLLDLTTSDIIIMSQQNFVLGKDCTNSLPIHYINRFIPIILLKIEAVICLPEDLFIIRCNTTNIDYLDANLTAYDLKKYLAIKKYSQFQKQNPMTFADFLAETKENSKNIYIITEENCTEEEFKEICFLNPHKNCHYVRFFNETTVEWILSNGGIDKLKKFQIDPNGSDLENYLVRDEDAITYFNKNLNIICSEAGMGKSVMLDFLMLKCPSLYWICKIRLCEHVDCFEKLQNIEEITDYFISKETVCSLSKKVLKSLFQQKLIYFLWDGFDEIPNDKIEFVINIINTLCNNGFLQWVSARTTLKHFLETTFNTFALSLSEFTYSNQYTYLYQNLKLKYNDEEIENIVTEVDKNIFSTLNCGSFDYTGIPLQLYMIVDIFLRRANKNSKVKLLTLTHIFQQFIEGKFDNLFERAEADLENYYVQEIRQEYRNTQMLLYEKAAAQYSICENTDLNVTGFLKELKQDGDQLGLIIGLQSNGKPIFAHKTYEEFLVASWLLKNYSNHPDILKNIFEEKYRAIRFMFDLLLTNGSVIHEAVLYRNFDVLKKYKSDIRTAKDLAGRSALQLLCSWGMCYPKIKTMKSTDQVAIRSKEQFVNDMVDVKRYMEQCFPEVFKRAEILKRSTGDNHLYEMYDLLHNNIFNIPILKDTVQIDPNFLTKVFEESEEYIEIIKFLLEEQCDPHEIDNVFKWNAFQFADYSLSLAALDQLLKHHSYILPNLYNYKHIPTVLHYGVNQNFNSLFKHVTAVPLILYMYDIGTVSLLQQACNLCNRAAVKYLLGFQCYRDSINFTSIFQTNILMDVAGVGDLELLELLIQNGANVNQSCTQSPLLLSILKGQTESCKKLLEAGADVNSNTGMTPLIVATLVADDIIYTLLEKGADVNYISESGCTALSTAIATNNFKMVQAILQYNPILDHQDRINGYTHLHYASLGANPDIVKCLLEHGADTTIKNNDSMLPLHVALIAKRTENAIELINGDPSVVNQVCSLENNLWTPLALAALYNLPDVILVLVKYGAHVNAGDIMITSALSVAAIKKHENCIQALIESGASVNYSNKEENVIFGCTDSLTTIKLLLEHGADTTFTNIYGETVMHICAVQGAEEVLQELIDRDVDFNTKTNENNTPLFCAIANNRIDNAKILMQAGAIIDNNEMIDLLTLVAQRNYTSAITFLIKNGVDINQKNKLGNTALCCAAFHKNVNSLQILLDNGADPNLENVLMLSPLACSVFSGKPEHTRQLLINAGSQILTSEMKFSPFAAAAYIGDIFSVIFFAENCEDINMGDAFGNTPLHYACDNCSPTINTAIIKYLKNETGYDKEYCVKELLARGANINQATANGITPLDQAFMNHNSKLVELLVENGADVNVVDSNGVGPLQLCCQFGTLEQAQLLLGHGAQLDFMATAVNFNRLDIVQLMIEDITEKNMQDDAKNIIQKSFFYAAQKGHLDIIEHFLENNLVQVDISDDSNITALISASLWGRYDVVKYLLTKGAYINKKDLEGNSALYLASKKGHLAIVQILKEFNADLNILTKKGHSPLFTATANGHLEILEFLYKCGAKVEVVDFEGDTPLHDAVAGNYLEIVQFLISKGANLELRNVKGKTPLDLALEHNYQEIITYIKFAQTASRKA